MMRSLRLQLAHLITGALVLAVMAVGLLTGSDASYAQRRSADQAATVNKELLNFNTVGIVTGKSDSAYLAIAEDLATVLDDGDNLRVLAVVGKGAAQNVSDVLFLRNVDLGITSANVLAHYKKVGGLGPNLEGRLVYVTKLFNEELHVIAGRGATDIRGLAGKVVNFGEVGSGGEMTARFVFEALKINVRAVNMSQPDALMKIKSGEVAATIVLAGKPSALLERILEAGDYKLLAVPFDEALEQDYLPSQFTSADYPKLVAAGASVDTIAVPAVLAAYNWPISTDRGRRLARFTEAFFSKFAELRKEPRHPKWHEVNLTAEVPGWQRLPAAKQWLDKNVPKVAAAPDASAQSRAATRKTFEQFLAEQARRGQPVVRDSEQEALFRKFMEFLQAQQSQQQTGGQAPAASAPAQRSQPSGTRLW